MNPTHKNPQRANRRSTAPYNFVPLPEQVVPAEALPDQDAYQEGRYTGHIDCTLVTKTPLYTRTALDPAFYRQWGDEIRKMMQDDEARATYAQFFHREDAEVPVIPGSSLRGMVRNLVEIVAFAKVKWVTARPLVFRAVGDTTSWGSYYRDRLMHNAGRFRLTPLMKAGFMERIYGEWHIRPAQEIDGTTFARIHLDDIPAGLARWRGCKNAQRIWVDVGPYAEQPVRGGRIQLKYAPVLAASATNTAGYQEAVLARSGHMDKKEREAVFYPPSAQDPIPVSDDLIVRYKEQISKEQIALLGDEGALQDGQPVFYLMEAGELVFFGHPMMFRLPYEHVPLDFVPEALRGDKVTDLAEAIFGYVPESKADKRAAYASRVFFNDAVLAPQVGHAPLADAPITPQILSGPKPTSFQHYLTQRNPDNRHRLDHYAESPQETAIRGHKLYWHRGPTSLDDVKEPGPVHWRDDPHDQRIKADTQHTQIRPVTEGTKFTFRVDFENLSKVELGALLWALEPAGAEGQEFCHKLGMGKPLGMGAVRLTPTLYIATRQERYKTLLGGGGWNLAEKPEPDRAKFKAAFETYVLDRIPADRNGAQALKDVPRLKHLLAMLAWRGPGRALTPYADYQDRTRRVLPTPLGVLGQPDAAPAPAQGGQAQQPGGTPAPASPVGPGRRAGIVSEFGGGHGTIVGSDGSEIEVISRNIECTGPRTLARGQRVSYEVGPGPNGRRAIHVRPE